jgi:hypothetical protein
VERFVVHGDHEVVKIAGEDGHSLPKSFIICVATGDSPCHNYLILMVLLMVQIVDFVTVTYHIWVLEVLVDKSLLFVSVDRHSKHCRSVATSTFPSSSAGFIKCHA